MNTSSQDNEAGKEGYMMLWDLTTRLGSESEIERWEGWEMKDEVRMEEEGVREKGETRVHFK